MKTIVVTHPNGYTGILYGKSSLSVKKDGKEVFHTGNRKVHKKEELYDILEDMPRFLSVLEDIDKIKDETHSI